MKAKIESIKAAICAVFLCLTLVLTSALITACSTFELVSDYVSDNPLIAQLATRQAVAQYIAEGETLEEEIARAQSVKKRITKVLLFVDENARATVPELMAVIDSAIDWDELTYHDRLLVQDIVRLVEIELEEATGPRIPEEARIVLVTLFRTAISAAQMYASR